MVEKVRIIIKNWGKRILVLIMVSVLSGVILSNFTEGTFVYKLATSLNHFIAHGSPRYHFLTDQGVPQLRYTRLENELYYNPVYVAIYGLYYYDRWQENGENSYFIRYYHIYPPRIHDKNEWLFLFLATADWLVDNLKVRDYEGLRYGVYEYDFEWPVYKIVAPWRSAMAQGLAMQVLQRAWIFTHDLRYLEAAELAMNSFKVPVECGGVTYQDSLDKWWYEEYAAPGATDSRVLNGMLHVLIALYEFHSLTNNQDARILLDRGLNALSETINLYTYTDGRFHWTYYDRLGNVANYKYHHININLMRRLFAMTGFEPLTIYRRWSAFSTPFFLRNFIFQRPVYLDISVLLINISFIALFILSIILIVELRKRCRFV